MLHDAASQGVGVCWEDDIRMLEQAQDGALLLQNPEVHSPPIHDLGASVFPASNIWQNRMHLHRAELVERLCTFSTPRGTLEVARLAMRLAC